MHTELRRLLTLSLLLIKTDKRQRWHQQSLDAKNVIAYVWAVLSLSLVRLGPIVVLRLLTLFVNKSCVKYSVGVWNNSPNIIRSLSTLTVYFWKIPGKRWKLLVCYFFKNESAKRRAVSLLQLSFLFCSDPCWISFMRFIIKRFFVN